MRNTSLSKSRLIAEMGISVALYIVLTYIFSFTAGPIRISFNFVVLLFAGIRLGAIPTALIAMVSDILGGMAFYGAGAFHLGITLNATLTGFLFGLLFYRSFKMKNLVIFVFLNEVMVSLILQSLWLSQIYNLGWLTTIISRSPSVIVMAIIKIIFIVVLEKGGWYQRIAKSAHAY